MIKVKAIAGSAPRADFELVHERCMSYERLAAHGGVARR
jgi:hypothetical protein